MPARCRAWRRRRPWRALYTWNGPEIRLRVCVGSTTLSSRPRWPGSIGWRRFATIGASVANRPPQCSNPVPVRWTNPGGGIFGLLPDGVGGAAALVPEQIQTDPWPTSRPLSEGRSLPGMDASAYLVRAADFAEDAPWRRRSDGYRQAPAGWR